jgi:hypothetical protein
MTVLQQIRCYKTGLCPLIQNETWIDVFRENDMAKNLDSFYSIFNCYFNLSCPKVRRNIVSALNVPWINNVIIAQIKLKTLTIAICKVRFRNTEIHIKHIKRNTVL